MTKTNDIQQTLIRQVAEQVFVKPGQTWLVDETTVRFVFGATKIDVAYDTGHDTYTVTVHKLNRKTYEATSETTSRVYAEDLRKFFPARYAKDENVRAMFASVRGAA